MLESAADADPFVTPNESPTNAQRLPGTSSSCVWSGPLSSWVRWDDDSCIRELLLPGISNTVSCPFTSFIVLPNVTSKTERMIVLELSASCPGVELDAKVAVEVAVTELPTEVVEGAAVAVTAASAPT